MPPLVVQLTLGLGEPATVRVNVAVPPVGTFTLAGEAEIFGASGALDKTWTFKGLEVAEPGFGFVTAISTAPAWALVAVPVAVSSDAETNVVARACESKLTIAPRMKLLPEIVTVKAPTLICDGEADETCGRGFSSVAVEVPFKEESDVTDASIVTAFGCGIWAGAVYVAARFPGNEMVPTEAFPPGTPFTDQVSVALLIPATLAVSCWVLPARTDALPGDTVTLWLDGPDG